MRKLIVVLGVALAVVGIVRFVLWPRRTAGGAVTVATAAPAVAAPSDVAAAGGGRTGVEKAAGAKEHRFAGRHPRATRAGMPLPASLAEVEMTAALRSGLHTLETDYYQSPEIYSIIDYRLGMFSGLDECLGNASSSHGFVRVWIKLVPAGGQELVAKSFEVKETDLSADDLAAISRCLRAVVPGSTYSARDASRIGPTTMKNKLTFPLAENPLYEFLRTGDYHLIAGPLPPASAPDPAPWTPGPTAQ